MYALIIVILMLSPTTSLAAGVTSQIVGKFENLDQCKAAAETPYAGGAISDLSFSRGIYWYCLYTGPK
jgi:hypothetical protein